MGSPLLVKAMIDGIVMVLAIGPSEDLRADEIPCVGSSEQ
jgi:hypothetical protein